jgi:hypothetical protein
MDNKLTVLMETKTVSINNWVVELCEKKYKNVFESILPCKTSAYGENPELQVYRLYDCKVCS